MIKSIIVYATVFFCLFLISYNLHTYFIEAEEIVLPFSLEKVYLFHLGFSLIICINLLVISTVDKIFEQLGYIYLGVILLKLILFIVIFYKSIFTEEKLYFFERLSLLIPMIIFLLTEVFFVAKILKKKQ